MDSKQLGNLGERIAENYLKNKGYQILDKNYSNKFVSGPLRGEIDIIAKKENIISFVEIKTLRQGLRLSSAECPQGKPLRQNNFVDPEEKVDWLKQRKIKRVAEGWLMKKKIPLDSKWQIDVISIKIDLENKKAKLQYFKNAVF